VSGKLELTSNTLKITDLQLNLDSTVKNLDKDFR